MEKSKEKTTQKPLSDMTKEEIAELKIEIKNRYPSIIVPEEALKQPTSDELLDIYKDTGSVNPIEILLNTEFGKALQEDIEILKNQGFAGKILRELKKK